jgi:hypothetical protein
MDMRTRLTLLALIATLLLAGYVAVGRGTGATRDIVETLATSSPEWRRETLYLVRSHSRFPAPIPPGQFGRNTYENEARLRILVLGDSYTYGWALADPDARWTVRLEAAIEAELGAGTVEVVAVAKPGASTYLHATWLQALMDGEDLSEHGVATEDLARLKGSFDAIVVGFVNNDRLADVPMEPEEQRAILEYEVENPNQRELEAALATIKQYAEGKPLMWAPLEAQYLGNPRYATVNERNDALFAAAGFEKIPMTETTEIATNHSIDTLLVTVGDEHPGEALTAAYARDTAATLLAKLPVERIAAAQKDGRGTTRPVVAGVLPVWATFDGGNGKYLISFARDAWEGQECHPLDLRGEAEVRCEEGKAVMYVDGAAYPDMAGPCQRLGRPYIHIHTDTFRRGGRLALRIEAGRADDFVVYRYGYDAEGFIKTELLGNADTRDTWPIGDAASGYALLLAARHVNGCALDASHIDVFDGVVLSIETAEN